jgi:hypothetical protein
MPTCSSCFSSRKCATGRLHSHDNEAASLQCISYENMNKIIVLFATINFTNKLCCTYFSANLLLEHASNMVDCIRDGINSAAALADKYDEPSKITCICCAELKLESEKTRIELRSAQKIIELQREDNLCCALCANASSSEFRRSTGLHQLNVLK